MFAGLESRLRAPRAFAARASICKFQVVLAELEARSATRFRGM